MLHSERFADAAPATVYATMLDEGVYLASESTMYRLLRERGETGDGRRQATHPAKVKPELVANAPNRVWSWDTFPTPTREAIERSVGESAHPYSTRSGYEVPNPVVLISGTAAP